MTISFNQRLAKCVFLNAFPARGTLARYEAFTLVANALAAYPNDRSKVRHALVPNLLRRGNTFAPVAMLIESTEQFQASAAIEIRRGPNELAESDFERLPLATRTKLRILQEHGVLRLRPSETAARPGSEK